MFRFLPLLTLTLLPAAVAAPVPPAAGRPAFGANGLLARADLEKVKFEPRPAGLGGGAERLNRRRFAPVKGFDKAAIAVHLPWHTFRAGEEVPAYFVFRNGSDRDLTLDARLDLYGPNPFVRNACAVNVTDRATGEPVHVLDEGHWIGGDQPLVVPANGFYCVRYDVGHTSDGEALPPGEYEVDWQCSGLHSAGVSFTVTKGAAGARPVAVPPRCRVHFYTLTPDADGERDPARPGAPVLWDACRLERVYATDVLAALAVGHGGAYIPDLHTIPDADRLVRVSAVWKPYRDGDRVAVTLDALDPRKPVRFTERPHLCVHFQTTTSGDLQEPVAEKAADPKDRANANLVTPLTIEARLPTGWREWTGVLGTPRVAVVVTSGRLERPRDRVNVRAAKDVFGPAGGPVWEGVLRTPFTELRFPPAPDREPFPVP